MNPSSSKSGKKRLTDSSSTKSNDESGTSDGTSDTCCQLTTYDPDEVCNFKAQLYRAVLHNWNRPK